MQVLFLLAAALGSPGVGAETVQFRAKEVLVSDSEGIPLFRGRRDFVLRLGHNPAGEVVAYDPRSKRVRVSKLGTELWLHCADLQPMATSCVETAQRQSRAGALRSAEEPELDLAAAVPSCPGDARCPKAPE